LPTSPRIVACEVDDRTEQALIARAKEGDRAAYEGLLTAATRSASRLAFAMLQDRSQAEDAMQEAALRAWRRLTNLRAGSRFEPWFMGIVANQCKEIRRGRWWQIARLYDSMPAEASDESVWLEGEDLRRAINELPFDQRAAVLLHFHADMPLSDVATALGVSTSGAKKRINRALKRLRPAIAITEVRANG
jgi:RNA polymerase sigma-70 factor, ECF subfamily